MTPPLTSDGEMWGSRLADRQSGGGGHLLNGAQGAMNENHRAISWSQVTC